MSFFLRKQKQELQKNLEANILKLKELETTIETMNQEKKDILLKWLISENIKLSEGYLTMFQKVNI